jgi:hypothetical protein
MSFYAKLTEKTLELSSVLKILIYARCLVPKKNKSKKLSNSRKLNEGKKNNGNNKSF